MTLDATFDLLCGPNWARKQVSRNDKTRRHLYVTMEIKHVMEVAGYEPANGPENRILTVNLVNGPWPSGQLSYYLSRVGRPEPRMSQQIVSQWLEEGDQFYIGFTGHGLIAAKESPSMTEADVEDTEILALKRFSDPEVLRDAAGRAPRRPAQRSGITTQYVRSPAVVAYVLRRANNCCEMPGCQNELFYRPDGSRFLEVHHVIPLSEGGDDSIDNAAALCPNCHRAQHFAQDRERRRELLLSEMQLMVGSF